MKNGVLRTPDLENQIYHFIQEVRRKHIPYFGNIEYKDREMFHELCHNFNENMIAQPLLSEYFHIVIGNKIFPDNGTFLEILKEKAEMFQNTPDDKSKYQGKKRYRIF